MLQLKTFIKLKKSGLPVISLAAGLLMAYSAAAHYFVWFSRPRTEKIAILLVCALVCVIAANLVLRLLSRYLAAGDMPRKIFGYSILISLGLTLFWLRNYEFIPFQTNHSLIVSPIAASAYQGERLREAQVELRGVFLPNGRQVSLREVVLGGHYFENDGVILLIGEGSSARYQGEFLGDVVVELRSGPTFGMALIEWDGIQQKIDAFSETDGVRRARLSGKSFGVPRFSWRVLAYLLYMADFATIFFVFGAVVFLICVLGVKIYRRDGPFWPILSLMIIATAGGAKALSPTGAWMTRIFGADFWYTNDPEGAYFGSAMHLFGPGRYPPFSGHPGLTLQFVLYLCSRVYYALNVFRGVTIPIEAFIARNQAGFFIFCSCVLGVVLVLALYLLYLLALDLTASRIAARLSTVLYVTSFPVLFFISRISVEYFMVLFYLGTLLALWRAEKKAILKDLWGAFLYLAIASLCAACGFFTKMHLLGLFPIYVVVLILLSGQRGNGCLSLRDRVVGAGAFLVFFGLFSIVFVQKLDIASFAAYWNYVTGYENTSGGLAQVDPYRLMSKIWFIFCSIVDNFSSFANHYLFFRGDWDHSRIVAISEYVYFIFAVTGGALFVWKNPKRFWQTFWLLGYLVILLPIVFYRLVFHYWFIHLALAAIYAAFALCSFFIFISRFLKLKRHGYQFLFLGALLIHAFAIFFFVNGKHYDAWYYRRHVYPYQAIVSQLEERERFGLVYDGRVSSPSAFDYHGVYEAYTPPELPIQRALNEMYAAVSIEKGKPATCQEAGKWGVEALLDTREAPAKVIYCR